MAAYTTKGYHPHTALMLMPMQTHCILTRTGTRDYDRVDWCAVGAETDEYEHVQQGCWLRQAVSAAVGCAYYVCGRVCSGAGTCCEPSAAQAAAAIHVLRVRDYDDVHTRSHRKL